MLLVFVNAADGTVTVDVVTFDPYSVNSARSTAVA